VEPLRFDRFGRSHHGLVTLDQAKLHGLSTAAWNRANREDGRALEPLFRNVARVVGAPTSAEQRILAAVLAAGSDAMASHRSAARLWGVERPDDDPIDIILASRNRRARLGNVVVHRPRDVVDLRPVVRSGVPTTNPLRVLLDLGAVDPTGVAPALQRFVMAGFVTPSSVSDALGRHSAKGRAGLTSLRGALERWMIDGKPSDSDLENQMKLIACKFGLPPLQFHAVVAGYEIDFLVLGTPIIVECDGWTTHGIDQKQFVRDRDKDNELHALGFIVHRVTASQLFARSTLTATRLARCIWTWAPDVAAAHLASDPSSVLGATRPR
jgi:very-short-patch-repair endonuclease